MAIRVIDPGLLTSVQDSGRPGLGASGVPRSGAADTLSLSIGNRLLGNITDDTAAAIEMTLSGPTLGFTGPCLICLVGAAAPEATIEHTGAAVPLPHCSPVVIPGGATLRAGPLTNGARAYLCIAGGVRSEPVLGSRSAHTASGLGGRPLAEGDVLETGRPTPGLRFAPLANEASASCKQELTRRALRLVPAAHTEMFDPAVRHALTGHPYSVSSRSDRTGVRLVREPAIMHAHTIDHSEAMPPGTVQLPPSGEPIVLGVDGPTIGGYPAIGSVIAADLPALAQARPNDAVRFEWTDLDGAHQALRSQRTLISSVPLPAPCHTSTESEP